VLNGTLSLHDVRDVERFCRGIANGRFELRPDEYDDLLVYLVETCWELSLGFQPGGVSFSTYAGITLRKRVFDWKRKHNGRTRWQFSDHIYERPLPQFVSLNDPDHDHLGAAVGTSRGDPQVDRSPDLARLLGGRGSSRARDYEVLGLEPPRPAP
jgi:hypothetical protein